MRVVEKNIESRMQQKARKLQRTVWIIFNLTRFRRSIAEGIKRIKIVLRKLVTDMDNVEIIIVRTGSTYIHRVHKVKYALKIEKKL